MCEYILNGEVDEKLIDNAVLNILTLKFKIGLFENPYAMPEKSEEVHNEHAVSLSRKAEEQAIVMLENDGILPIDEKKINKVAVIGNNAKDSFLGDYIKFTDSCVSFYDGMVNRLGEDRVLYTKGCNSISGTDEMIAEAVEIAKQSDVVFLVLGDTAAEGGGVAGDGVDDKEVTCAEGYDMHTLSLMPSQNRLFNSITALGKPVVFVLYSGRAMALEEESKKVNALLFSWGAGEQSGNAFANIIFGDVSPSAKLSISMPRSVGHIPCHYNYKVSARGSWYKKPGSVETPGRDYVLSSPNALYPFGYGLSYTEIKYSDLKAEKIGDGQIQVSVKVHNAGEYDICESVLLYTKALFSPVTPFVKQLKRFDKIELKKGETKVVKFVLNENDFTYIDENYKEAKLNGKHKILVGKLECDIDI